MVREKKKRGACHGVPGTPPERQTITRLSGLGLFDHRRLVGLAAAATERLQTELRELLRVDAVALAHREPLPSAWRVLKRFQE